jgi:hypothetical protein
MRVRNVLLCLLFGIYAVAVHADDAARFDLVGPKISVRVTRGSITLPIAQVPNLLAGDKIWVKADLPASQSNHLLLIVAFLRGTTNEPPDNWFTEIQTWDKKDVEGTVVTVPAEAQQALLFIAPETGGDFKTLRSAVKGKPGLFIRADADLNEASFEQERIERYLAGMKTVPAGDPKAIQEHSAKLAATLGLKPDDKCLKLPVDQQVTCLTQSRAPVLMQDGHGQNIAEALSSGASSNLIVATAATPAAAVSSYSGYVGAVVDLVQLVALLKTAQYAYIPGLSFPEGETLNLKLNAPPSFHNPKSVIVIGLPEIQKAKLPPLRPHDPNQVSCLLQPKVTLPVDGAPLVFATAFAHDLVLHVNRTGGTPVDVPLKPDAYEGGLTLAKQDAPAKGDVTVTGTIRGRWGFDPFEGPTVTLQEMDGKDFKVVGNGQLLAGQDNKLTLQGDATGCVEKVQLTSEKGKPVDVTFKPDAGKAKNTLALDVSLKTVEPGGYALAVGQYGAADPAKVPLTAYDAGIKLDGVKIHAGDKTAVLTGTGLKDVAAVQIGDQAFAPAASGNDDKTVKLEAKAGVSPADGSKATVKLKDGRTMEVKVSTAAARPALKLLSFKATPAERPGTIAVVLGGQDEIALDGKLTFVVQTKDVFPRTQTIEVATANEAVHTTLSLEKNTLVLQDEHTAVATLDPLKSFGQSAFGKLQMRPVGADGTAGDWTALGVLVRTPEITGIACEGTASCKAQGKNFFLVQTFGAGKDFAKAADVPTGYADGSIGVPVPADGSTLYLKLRDDPGAVAMLKLPAPVGGAPVAPVAGAPAAPAGASGPAPAVGAAPVPAPAATPVKAQ